MNTFRLKAELTVDIEPGSGHVGFSLAGRSPRPACYEQPSSEVVYTFPKPLACDLLAMPLPLSQASTSRSMLEQIGGMLFISSNDGQSLLHGPSMYVDDEAAKHLADLFFTVSATSDFDPSSLDIEINPKDDLDGYLIAVASCAEHKLRTTLKTESQEQLASHAGMHPIQYINDYTSALPKYLKSGFLKAQSRFNDDADYALRIFHKTDKVLFEGLMRDTLSLGSEHMLIIDGESVTLTESRDSRPAELMPILETKDTEKPYVIEPPARGRWLPDNEPSGPEF